MGKTSKTGSVIRNLRDALFGSEERLINKYAIGEKTGKLRFQTCPEVQQAVLELIKPRLVELLKAREESEDSES